MQTCEFLRATTRLEATEATAGSHTAQHGAERRFIAGGTTLLDLMKLHVETPTHVVDINSLPFNTVVRLADGSVRIGAMVRNAELAHHPLIKTQYPVLSEAILSGASAQLRNMATTGGNLLQRTRCSYFRATHMACNKRQPGSGCSAITGEHRTMAILGTSADCIATHPSDMAVAMLALDATAVIEGRRGRRSVPIADFHLLPGTTPHLETVMAPGDVVTHVTVPAMPVGSRSAYLKLRDRASYEFALASAGVALVMNGVQVTSIRICMGGIGTKPWRCKEAEDALTGQQITTETLARAAEAALAPAKPLRQNAFKVELAKRCLMQAVRHAARQEAL